MLVHIGLLDVRPVQARVLAKVSNQPVLVVGGVIVVIRPAQLRALLQSQHLHGHRLVLTRKAHHMPAEVQRHAPDLQPHALDGAALHGLAVREGLCHFPQVPCATWLLLVAVVHDEAHEPHEVAVHVTAAECTKTVRVGRLDELHGVVPRLLAVDELLHAWHVLREDLGDGLGVEPSWHLRRLLGLGHLHRGAQEAPLEPRDALRPGGLGGGLLGSCGCGAPLRRSRGPRLRNRQEELEQALPSVRLAGRAARPAQEDSLEHCQRQGVVHLHARAGLLVEHHVLLRHALGGPVKEGPRQRVLPCLRAEAPGLRSKGFQQGLCVEELRQARRGRLAVVLAQGCEPVLRMLIKLRLPDVVPIQAHGVAEVREEPVLIVCGVKEVIRAAELRADLQREHFHGHGLVLSHEPHKVPTEVGGNAPNPQAHALYHAALHCLAVREGLRYLPQMLRSARLLLMPVVHDQPHECSEVLVDGRPLEGL
mmetsp:Transcript_47774/g.152417  ORF Transcript_47774/g.152417 Transcript_47774/m.152417 type:complete len:479 (-) Transcript_47774:792-2228(-)